MGKVMKNTCFFLGHHFAPQALRPLLEDAVERHIADYGVTQFIVGSYGSFDAMAAGAVIRAKSQHNGISLLRLLPYHPSERAPDVPDGFDGTFYPAGMETVPHRAAIVRANEYVLRHVCDYLICFDRYSATKTHVFLEIAKTQERKRALHIENLADRV